MLIPEESMYDRYAKFLEICNYFDGHTLLEGHLEKMAFSQGNVNEPNFRLGAIGFAFAAYVLDRQNPTLDREERDFLEELIPEMLFKITEIYEDLESENCTPLTTEYNMVLISVGDESQDWVISKFAEAALEISNDQLSRENRLFLERWSSQPVGTY